MRIRLVQSRLGLINSTTRLPFRYGQACLTKCPQAVLEATIEMDGQTYLGYSGDCLPPSWFDKSPAKDYQHQIADMLQVISLSQEIFLEEFKQPRTMFDGWLVAQQRVHLAGDQERLPGLLSGFGTSLLERAMIDAMCRGAKMRFADLVHQNLLHVEAGAVSSELNGAEPADWLPPEPCRSVFVRQTVGLADPLTEAEIPEDERLSDGYPQALEQYVQQFDVQYFKVKVSNQLDIDMERLVTLAEMVERHLGNQYFVTLDGNEQYSDPADFDELIHRIQSDARLDRLWDNTLLIEQPLPRDIALDDVQTEGIRRLCKQKPVIIDESDEQLDAYRQAINVGYRGISSKNCKGPIRSLLNAGLTWRLNADRVQAWYAMTGEDLCSVGIIPVQADLCLAATLGLTHVERNGHHYHPGLTYLPEQQRRAALVQHGDFYSQSSGTVRPCIRSGRFDIESLQCVGFGFAVVPDFGSLQSPDEWEFASLGL